MLVNCLPDLGIKTDDIGIESLRDWVSRRIWTSKEQTTELAGQSFLDGEALDGSSRKKNTE